MTPLSGAAASSPAEPGLFEALIDDAAVFPPGLAPLPDAVREHRAHRSSRYAALIGPLLVPASDAAAVVELVPSGAEPLRVGLIARPGTSLHVVTDALHLLREHPEVQVSAVELGWTPEWRDLDPGVLEQVPALVLEVPRGADQGRALDDIAEAVTSGTGASGPVVAKFRTGATPAWAWPDEEELAAFLHAATARRLPFKLTGGLHHAVRGAWPVKGSSGKGPGEEASEEQHGLLNVLCAVAGAVDGLNAESLAHLLAERDPEPLAREVAALTAADAERVRALFTAYGCCGVTDPVTELSELNLIEEM